ncbi:chloramphenicol-sensitive protein RarD [Desulfitispora alkaliphila]|uniref:EamA family transporter RarD n=1 Tax=Desulfitispora alkaliphila TaxID=622674 RepID=UPI003D22029A
MGEARVIGEREKGIIFALIAYVAWGLLPLYWKLLNQVPADQVLAHRILWSFCFVGIILTIAGSWKRVKTTLSSFKHLKLIFACGFIISCNWFTYIWAVSVDRVVEASMGYYISPLVTVLLGVIILKEKLSFWSWFAVILAGAGVAVMTINYGQIPWVALTLALTFAFYGLMKKMLKVDSITGLFLETAVMMPLALAYLIFQQSQGFGAVGSVSTTVFLLLVGAGVATASPLLFFAMGAHRVELSTLGFIQYIAPTISLYLGVVVFKEEFTQAHMIGFGFIWVALFIYTAVNFKFKNKVRQQEVASKA